MSLYLRTPSPPDLGDPSYTPPAVYGDYDHSPPAEQQHPELLPKQEEPAQNTPLVLAKLLNHNHEIGNVAAKLIAINARHELAINELTRLIGLQEAVIQDIAVDVDFDEREEVKPTDHVTKQLKYHLGKKKERWSSPPDLSYLGYRQPELPLIGPQLRSNSADGSSEKQAQDVDETLEELRSTRSFLLEVEEDPWEYAKSLYSERLLQASDYDDLLVWIQTSARYLECFEEELTGRHVKPVIVSFATAIGTLTGQLIKRLKLREQFREWDEEFTDHEEEDKTPQASEGSDWGSERSESPGLTESTESEPEQSLLQTSNLPQFPSTLTLMGKEGDWRTQTLYHDDFRAYYEIIRREAADLQVQIAARNMDALHPFYAVMGLRTKKFLERVWTRRVVAGIDFWGPGALEIPAFKEIFEIPERQ